MAGQVAVDTSFLIDLQRERLGGEESGPAHRFLTRDPDLELHLPAVALGEFAEGFGSDEDPVLRLVRELHVILPVDEATALEYGRLTGALRMGGRLIGSNDLWIAAAAVRHGLPLVTGSLRDFRQVEGLEVLSYR